jgi:hypothetical protein
MAAFDEPWAERTEGARRAARDTRAAVQRLIGEHLAELVTARQAYGEVAARAGRGRGAGTGGGMNELDELRAEVAVMHGLPDDATRFLTADSLPGLEAQADALTRLLGDRDRPEPEPEPLADLFTRGSARKAEAQTALLEALGYRRPPPRDEQGRYTRAGGGFDGDARQPVSASRDPEADHNALLAQLAQISRTFGHSL